VLELERDSKREKRKGKKWVSVEGGKEREKRIRENRKGEGIFWKQEMTSTTGSNCGMMTPCGLSRIQNLS
jgi:hypothetical protein